MNKNTTEAALEMRDPYLIFIRQVIKVLGEIRARRKAELICWGLRTGLWCMVCVCTYVTDLFVFFCCRLIPQYPILHPAPLFTGRQDAE
jgi:hypothetical protein